MAFEIYGSVDVSYSPVTKDMVVRAPSHFLKDGALVLDPAQMVQMQCKSDSISFLFPSYIFQPCTLRPDACPPST